MKMSTSFLKSAFKAVLGAVLAAKVVPNLAKSWRHQFARSILGASYLSIQADLALALV